MTDPSNTPAPKQDSPPAITVVEKPGTARGNRINVSVIKPPKRNPRFQRRRG